MINKKKETVSADKDITNKEILQRVELIPGFLEMSAEDQLIIISEELKVSSIKTAWDHLPPSKCNVCSNNTMRVDWVGIICTTCGFDVDSHTKDVINCVRKKAGISLPEMSKLTGYGVEDIRRFEDGEVPEKYYQAFKYAITRHFQ